ncbi:MAG: hypothetical protein M1275_00750 [Patescibacteria group bacterium]|nr:hypothetical protein [Patescibacteria group bacterium]
MELIEVLKKAGLSEKESSVYLALMELGEASVEGIAKKAGTKRPTTYLVLDDLQAKGLVSLVPHAKKALYTAESPEKLISDLDRKQELLKRFLPNFLGLYNSKKEKPQVLLFEGKEGIKQVYDKIYSANEVSFFGTVREALNYDSEGLFSFVKRTQEQNVKVRDLLTHSSEDLDYARKAQQGKNYEIRFVPKNFNFPTDNAIFGDCVVFFSFHPTIFSVMIKSKEISGALLSLFNMAWAISEPFGTASAALENRA